MTSHLNALQLRLSNERQHLANAKSAGEIALRTQWVLQIQCEIIAEGGFVEVREPMTDDELFAELLK
jgi:hypothetical protein